MHRRLLYTHVYLCGHTDLQTFIKMPKCTRATQLNIVMRKLCLPCAIRHIRATHVPRRLPLHLTWCFILHIFLFALKNEQSEKNTEKLG